MRGGAKLNTAAFDRIMRRAAKVRAVKITVGIHRGETDKKGSDVAVYAAANNAGVTKNGKIRIPARPFMSYSADEIAKFLHTTKCTRLLFRYIKGEITANQLQTIIGKESVRLTKKTILDSALYKENADITKKRKGSSKPLVMTGIMSGRALTWKKG